MLTIIHVLLIRWLKEAENFELQRLRVKLYLDALEGSAKELSRVECEGATGTGAGTSA